MADQWSEALKSMSPKAGNPGMGRGNQPYARGVISGKTGVSPEAAQMIRQMPAGYGPKPQQQPQPGMPSKVTVDYSQPQQQQGNMPQQGAMPPPQMYAAVLQYLMSLMTQRAATGETMNMSSTGGFAGRMRKPY